MLKSGTLENGSEKPIDKKPKEVESENEEDKFDKNGKKMLVYNKICKICINYISELYLSL